MVGPRPFSGCLPMKLSMSPVELTDEARFQELRQAVLWLAEEAHGKTTDTCVGCKIKRLLGADDTKKRESGLTVLRLREHD